MQTSNARLRHIKRCVLTGGNVQFYLSILLTDAFFKNVEQNIYTHKQCRSAD